MNPTRSYLSFIPVPPKKILATSSDAAAAAPTGAAAAPTGGDAPLGETKAQERARLGAGEVFKKVIECHIFATCALKYF